MSSSARRPATTPRPGPSSSSRAGQQLERLDWLAQNLLELSKLDSGLVLLDLRPDDLRSAVESAVEQADPAARRRGVALTVSLPARPVRIRHDPQRIGQVVTNLVGNALKFTPRGGAVSVELQPIAEGARIEVRDTGVGIDASELPRVFDRFYRGSRANEARGSGSGLGLAIVKSIVDLHAGRITVDSRVGVGATFVVTLPKDPRTAAGGDAGRPGRDGFGRWDRRRPVGTRRLRRWGRDVRPVEETRAVRQKPHRHPEPREPPMHVRPR